MTVSVLSAIITSGAVLSLVVVILSHVLTRCSDLDREKIDKELYRALSDEMKNQVIFISGSIDSLRLRLENLERRITILEAKADVLDGLKKQ